MARRRSRRRKSSYEQTASEDAPPAVAADELSPRARRLVESGVIDLAAIAGTGEEGRITSGDILHAARVMEMEQSVARIETTHAPVEAGQGPTPAADEEESIPSPADSDETDDADDGDDGDDRDSDTSSAAAIGVEPIAVEPTPWEDYNGSTEGLSEIARPGADQSWGEAEAHLAAMAEETSVDQPELPTPEPVTISAAPGGEGDQQDEVVSDEPALITEASVPEVSGEAAASDGTQPSEQRDVIEPVAAAAETEAAPDSHREVMMDFGTLELVDPESVWAEGAEDFAPWFLAHSQQLGDVLGLNAGLTDARQFTTKSATGVLGRDDNGEDVVVVSSKSATADDSDLGHALGMAASSGAASVALVSASIDEDQLKALAWLNNQTKSGVKWYGIEMRVVRIADSPAAMLFDLVAAPRELTT